MADNPYEVAYNREKKARLQAEKLLEDKTRELYKQCIQLEETNQRLSSTEKKLVQSDKMSSLGQLAAGVAHEINNPLSYSLCNLGFLSEYFEKFELLAEELKKETFKNDESLSKSSLKNLLERFEIDYICKDGHQLIKSTTDGLNKIGKIASSLKQVSHQNAESDAQCNINDSIKSSIKVVWNELRYTMKVDLNLEKVPLVSFDNGEIHQVLMNLFLNAKHACGEKGRLSVSTSLEELERRIWVKVEVSDNGTGIPAQIIERIFEPFYTTKPVGEGTGLGLSISLSIIESYGGRLKVTSELGEGSTFSLYLKPVLPHITL